MKISVIIPAFNELINLKETTADLSNHLSSLTPDYEIIIIDDHSNDDTFKELASWNNPNIKCFRLSRRCGSHTAIRAGLHYAKGDLMLCMAADGQEDLNVLPELVAKWKGGAQVIWGVRKVRKENFVIKILAEIFYKTLNCLTQNSMKKIDLSKADFFALDRAVVNGLNEISEKNTSLFGLLTWMGFQQDAVEYNRRPRRHGKSKWSFKRRLNLATDWIIAFSGLPLKLMTIMGVLLFSTGFLYALYILWNAFHGAPIEGWSSIMIVILVFGGVQMIMLGTLGEYLWRNLEESRKRPLFFIEKSTDVHPH